MNGFIEVDYTQKCKHSERIAGDVFLHSRDSVDGRIVCTLSDGLGSGVKANVLANLTATMGQKFTSSRMNIVDSAKVIMNTLPVCRERKISYSTFTMVDIDPSGKTAVIEYDNPPFILLRDGKIIPQEKETAPLKNRFPGRDEKLLYSELELKEEDRMIFFSDGVSQSGIGTASLPLGWRKPMIEDFVIEAVEKNSNISAGKLSRMIVNRALRNDIQRAQDDITCAVVYPRKPRKLLLLSGPPIDPANDDKLVSRYRDFNGRKIICGGTTAGIIAGSLGEEITTNLAERTADVPPVSYMNHADLITEGILTLSKTAELLEVKDSWCGIKPNAATRLITYLMDTDEVHFLIGTKINEAHQDPSIPVELGLRRNIINRIRKILEEKYLKQTVLEYL